MTPTTPTKPPTRLLRLPALLLAAALAVAPGGALAAAPVRGVVLVTIDTLRADHVGSYDPQGSLTPALDRLAAAGVVVEDAFTPTPTTGPAHASLFTGLHPWHHRVLDNAVPVDARFATLAETLRGHGVRTAAVVSSFVLDPRFGLGRGFDRYDAEQTSPLMWRGKARESFYRRGEDTTRAAVALLNEFAADRDGRFLLWVHYFDPHFPYDPPAPYRIPSTEPVDLTGKSLADKVPSFDVLARLIRRYRGEVRYTDAVIDPLLLRLEILGLADETAVIVTADHGEGLGDHGHMAHGANLYNELVRVPLLIRAPGLRAGRRLGGPAQLEDLFPTVAALLGVPVPEGLDGVDLLPWLRGERERSPRRAALGRRKTYADEPVLFYEWRADRKWIGELDAPGDLYASGWGAPELEGRAGEGAPAALRERVGAAAETADERRQLDPEVEAGLRALGYLD